MAEDELDTRDDAERNREWLAGLGMPVVLAILHNEADTLVEDTGAASLADVGTDEARRLAAALDILDPVWRLAAAALSSTPALQKVH